MAAIKDNWYLILELEFDPNPVTDITAINARIEEKRKFWSAHFNDFKHGAEYRRYVQEIPRIKTEMADAGMRKQMIADACDKTYKPIDTTLKQLNLVEIPEDVVENIAEKGVAGKKKVPVDLVKRRCKALGMKIVPPKHQDAPKIYDEYYKKKPQNYDKYRMYESNLVSMQVENLYQFLAKDSASDERTKRNSSCTQLLQDAKDLKTSRYNKNDSISGTGAKLCASCEQAFANEQEKAAYDAYLDYEQRRKILDEVKTLNSNGLMDGNDRAFDNFLQQLTQVMKDRKLASRVLISFCVVEKIPFHEEKQEEDKNITVCRCGAINHVAPGTQGFCINCGLPLVVKCPKCGRSNPNNVKACPKCGFLYANLDKAQAACTRAEESLGDMNFEAASFQLDTADQLWPGNERTKKIRTRLQSLKTQVGDIARQMEAACKAKKYYAAKQLLDRIRSFSPSFRNAPLESEIDAAISAAENYRKKAQTAGTEDEVIDACAKAYEASVDCPGIAQIMSSHKPAAPSALQAAAIPDSRLNALHWTGGNVSRKGSIYYVIRRREGARPAGPEDGTLVARVSGTSCNDSHIQPGIEYYYAVYTERAGVYSQDAAQTDVPIINLFEISNARATAGDASVALSWDMPAPNATPEVVRIDHGRRQEVPISNRTGVLDKGLTNESSYAYHLCLVYRIGAQTKKTRGVDLLDVRPSKPPRAIEEMSVKATGSGIYQLTYENPEKSDVHFYYAERRPAYGMDELVAVTELEHTMHELMVQKTGEKTATFRYTKDDTIYVMAVVIKSGAAVTGSIVRVSKGGAVKVESVFRANGKIVIKTNEPKGCTGFIVLYRHDHLPSDLDDKEAGRKYFSRKQYEYDNSLKLDDDGKGDYYISVFGEFRHVGEDTDYSEGADCELKNPKEKTTIYYEIHAQKKLFGGMTVEITFSSDEKEFELPDIDVMSTVGAAPIFKRSATLYESIPGCMVTGTKTIPLSRKTVAKNSYVKPFLSDEDADKSSFVLKLKGSIPKIS